MATPTFFLTLWGCPMNTISILFMLCLWFYLWNGRFTGELLSVSYSKVIDSGEWWRVITAAYTHLTFLHIAFNMFGLYQIALVETDINSLEYLRLTYVLLMGSEFFYIVIAWSYRRFMHRDTLIQQAAVGYSGVLFGWMAYGVLKNLITLSLFGLNLPQWLIPWLYLVLTQLIIKNASFVGHLAGLLIGHIMAWGAFDWFEDYLFGVCVFWTIIAFIYSLKISNQFQMSWIQAVDANDRELTVRNGEIIYMDNDNRENQALNGDYQDELV